MALPARESPADLSSATWLDAEWLLVVNPDGTVHRHQKVDGALVELEPLHFPEFAASVDLVETVLHSIMYEIQTLREIGNPAEAVFKQEETAEEEITIKTDSRLVSEFLLNPAAIVFLDDVAKEYGVQDTSFFSAMVPTIIYRELQDLLDLGLRNADNPAYQHNWDMFKIMVEALFQVVGIEQIVKKATDPSLGIGALNREAMANIEQDAKHRGIDIYYPVLGFDDRLTMDDVPFSKGEHEAFTEIIWFIPWIQMPSNRAVFPVTAIPPSNEQYGNWRLRLPQSLSPYGRFQEIYEFSLGYIAAEVAIAMRTSDYQKLRTKQERIAFIIGYHANRSRVPGKEIYDLSNLSDESRRPTRTEIAWAESFEGLMDDRREEIQSDAQNE